MNKKTKIALIVTSIATLIGFGAYYLIKQISGVDKSDKTDEEEGLEKSEGNKLASSETTSIVSGDYVKKIKTLQELLGFTGSDVDGIIGKNTKARLQERGLSTDVTPSNIDSIIKSLKAKTSSEALTKARIQRAKAITKEASFSKEYTWIDKPSKLKLYVKDKLGNYNATNTVLNVSKDSKIKGISNQTILKSGMIRAKIKFLMVGEFYIYVSPYSITIY